MRPAQGTAAGIEAAPPADDIVASVDRIMARYPAKTGLVLNTLNDVQDLYRYLPEEALARIAENAGVPAGDLRQMAGFFSTLSLVPTGRYVLEVCDGTCCHLQGAPRLMEKFEQVLGIKEGEVTEDGMISIKAVNCVGACGVAPVVVAKEHVFGCVRMTEVASIAESVRGFAEEEGSQDAAGLFAHLEEAEGPYGRR